MWRKRRSALFMDFENVRTRVSPQIIESLTAWLEDGRFDEPGGRRKLITKRVYWNSSDEKHREAFEAAGFEVVLCEKFASMKNGADIRMALDIADTCWRLPDIKEYILFTTDSDFVPVLQRLSEKKKLSAILVSEAKPSLHTAFGIFADVLIPMRNLMAEGVSYQRPKASLLAGLRKQPRAGSTLAGKAASTAAAKGAPAEGAEVARPRLDEVGLLAQAERAVVRVASRTPKKFAPRRAIEAQLQHIKGFKKTGAGAYFGKQHYQGLMTEIGRKNARIKVQPGKSRSASVMYVPDE